VRYRKADWDSKGKTVKAYFVVQFSNGIRKKTDLPPGFQNIDLLWSPDSKTFFINGGNGGGYWGFWVYVNRLEDPKLEPVDVTAKAQLDMVESFPPCKASGLDKDECQKIGKEPDFNMSGIDWAGDSSKIIVMAEVPCSGGHGGIMCQVMGYELEIPTGKILRRMTALQFGREWRKSIAWKFSVPDPPEYCTPENHQKVPGCMKHDW
jgi:hypothetical protein